MKNCIFCRIVSKEIASDIVLEKKSFVVIKDIEPKAPIHYLIIPKKHIVSLNQLKYEDRLLAADMILAIKGLAKEAGILKSGYRVIINTGKDGGQLVPHLHFHLLGGRKIVGDI